MADLTVMAVLKKLGKDILGWVKGNCVNNLVSTATNLPLAANQGKVLDEKIDAINQSLDSKIFIQSIEIPMDDYNITKRITFSGKIQTRTPIGIIIVAGQDGLSDPISFFFKGMGKYESIGDVCISSNPQTNVKTSGKSLVITSDYSGWGVSKIIFFGEYSELKWSIG